MNTQSFVSREDALDIVFANRNRNYGAYQLRRQYPKTLGRALGGALVLIGLLLALPHIMKAFSGFLPEKEKRDDVYTITEVKLSTPPPPKPPVPMTPPPVARATQRFVPPVVEEDDKVNEEPEKLSVDDLIKDPSEVGKTNIDGPGDGPPSLDDPGLGTLIEEPVKAPSDEPLELFDLQKPPSFPGGEAELLRFLAKNIQYPELARENNIQGTVVVSFVINKEGGIQDVTVLRELGGGCSKEAVRVLKSMPNWKPGEAHGYPVKVRYTIPVKFQLQ